LAFSLVLAFNLREIDLLQRRRNVSKILLFADLRLGSADHPAEHVSHQKAKA